jgi:uncharacterized protein YqgV (UPF0045/DUF77 family)
MSDVVERKQQEARDVYMAALDAAHLVVRELDAQRHAIDIRLSAKRREIADLERLVGSVQP